MAIYEYRCHTCGARLEVMQPMGSQPLETCGEECVADPPRGRGEVERLFSVVNVGSGRERSDPDPSCGRCGRSGPDVCG
ncbi:MAG: FmdB family zinc ribbon protein [Planctomycetota bacterium JB042]